MTIIGGASKPPRPLTSTAHELLHLIGLQHAGQNCPGTGVGSSQQGVPWPPDDMGYIQGVGLDRRPNSGGTGLYKIIAPGVGQPQWYDLMSYCANFDADAWLSTVNWSKFVATDPAPAAPAPDKSLATTTAAGRIIVDAALVAGGKPMLLGSSSTTSPPTRSTPSRYHIKALGSGGRVIANVGVVPEQIDDSPLMMLTATLRGAGATTLELTSGSHVIATLRRPTPLPSVRLTVPHSGLKAARHQLTIRWRARGARGVTLTAAIQYLASAKLGYQTLAAGITAGSYSVPISMFAHATRIHIRIVINDGFSSAIATSGLVKLRTPLSHRRGLRSPCSVADCGTLQRITVAHLDGPRAPRGAANRRGNGCPPAGAMQHTGASDGPLSLTVAKIPFLASTRQPCRRRRPDAAAGRLRPSRPPEESARASHYCFASPERLLTPSMSGRAAVMTTLRSGVRQQLPRRGLHLAPRFAKPACNAPAFRSSRAWAWSERRVDALR